MYKTISLGPPAVKLQAWKDLTRDAMGIFFHLPSAGSGLFPFER